MKRFNILLLAATSVLIFVSCSEKPDIQNTDTYKMSGEWFVTLRQNGTAVAPVHKIMTYNTAEPNSGKIWLNDLNYWPFKGKLDVDYSTLSFKAATGIANEALANKTAKVMEGKIIPAAAHSKSGNVVDSIYLKMEFSDDPGEIYEYSGHLRTGFFEDEY
ncbi:MAG: lipid-binding protein [Ferruginibacter sp.]